MHLQEHKSHSFEAIISDGDDLTAYTKDMDWRELGVDATGKTEALIFDSVVKRERNPFMFKQYSNGYVTNHSVGMQYVKLSLAVNSDEEEMQEEKQVWDKYINEIVNKDSVEKQGYFWAIHEAKVLEGSAVPMGSNWITPTLDVHAEKSHETENDADQKKEVDATSDVHQQLRNFYLNI